MRTTDNGENIGASKHKGATEKQELDLTFLH